MFGTEDVDFIRMFVFPSADWVRGWVGFYGNRKVQQSCCTVENNDAQEHYSSNWGGDGCPADVVMQSRVCRSLSFISSPPNRLTESLWFPDVHLSCFITPSMIQAGSPVQT